MYIRHPALQTVMASARLRRLGKNPMIGASREHLLDGGSGIRLSGLHAPVAEKRAKGLVILLHGWEGSVNSTYMLSCGRYLFRHDFAVFRINYRDHGDSHHLNKGLFYATRLEEVYRAVEQAARLSNGLPVFLAGFSLGGNFALRIARLCRERPIPGLAHIVSISPVLDPDKATDRIDGNPLLLFYFMKKWKQSLNRKQRLFPDRYDFTDILRLGSIREMTDALLERYSDYPDTATYFRGYGVRERNLAQIPVPTTVVTAADDPVIPVADFYRLRTPATVDLIIHDRGGHNGFIDSLLGSTWYDRFMLGLFS